MTSSMAICGTMKLFGIIICATAVVHGFVIDSANRKNALDANLSIGQFDSSSLSILKESTTLIVSEGSSIMQYFYHASSSIDKLALDSDRIFNVQIINHAHLAKLSITLQSSKASLESLLVDVSTSYF
jgi:hypothetical protein